MATDLVRIREMKQVIWGLSLCLLSSLALAGEKVNETIKADKDGYVKIEHMGGVASIKGWSRSEVRVVGELGDRTEEFIFERDGNEVVIKVKVKSNRGSWNWNSDDGDELEIFVPYESQVNYTSVNANVEVVEIRGSADIDTVNGSIEVADLKGRLRIEAVNGDITASNLEGDIKIETVNGDIRDRNSSSSDSVYESVNGDINVESNSPEVKVETVNGDIEVSLQKIEQLYVGTVNGEIDARMELARNGDVRANSVGGSVNLYFQKDVSARFDLNAHAGGRIVNKLSNHKEQKAKYGPNRWLEFSLNGGNGKVNVSTVSGRIKIDSK